MLTDPIILYFVVSAFVALGLGFILSLFNQPVFIAYIIAGFLLGPNTFGFFDDLDIANQLGSIGVVLLLFFIGMEVSPVQLIAKWRIAFIGTTLQIAISFALVALLGSLFDWPLNRSILIGFVISLSCTAVVADYMKSKKETHSEIYQNLIAMLVAQDLLVVPMLIILGIVGDDQTTGHMIWWQLSGTVLVSVFVYWCFRKDIASAPIINKLRGKTDLQVFSALLFCFAFSSVTGFFGLSTALGSFIAGLIIGRTHYADWVRSNLDALRIIFVALFFGSIGAIIDPLFFIDHWLQILSLLGLLFIVNTLINSTILKALGCSIPESVYGGALLAHIGEFSFVLAAIGLSSMIVSDVAYQITVAVIALSMLLGPMWVALIRRLLRDKLPTIATEKSSQN
jgi:CPA2 family monovalent cation:H+ antiporter-2